MKTTASVLRNVIAIAALALLPLSVQAQLTWGVSGTGGTGTWNASNLNWYDGASNVIWNSGSANFAGTAGNVTVSGTQNATDLAFATPSYTVSGGTINLTGGSSTIRGVTTINSLLTSTTGATFINGSKTLGGNNVDLDGLITISGTGAAAGVVRMAHSNALGDSAAFADRINLVQSTQGVVLQLNGGLVVSKYITTVGNATIETISGSSTLTGNIVNAGALFFQMGGSSVLTLTGSAGLGQSTFAGFTLQTGRLILDANGGASALGSFRIGGSTTVQVNNVTNPFGSVNTEVRLGTDAGGGTTLALNGGTLANRVNVFATGTSRKIENMSSGLSTISGTIAPQANLALVLRSTTSGTLRVSGHIDDGAFSGTVQVGNASFANSGVVELSRLAGNTYDGGTAVNTGTLLVNNTSNSATGTGAVTVASGATLGGDGFISGATTVNGIIAPGNSIGILNVANDVTWNGGASASSATDWKFELGASNTADLLNITGVGSDFLKGSGSVFRFDFQGSTAVGTFRLVDWAGITNFLATEFSYTNLGAANTGTFAFNGSQLEFVAVVPEPNTVALLVLAGMGGMLFLRKRKSAPVVD